MNAITIHGLDGTLAALLKAKARAEGTSINRLIKRLLEEALGVKRSNGKHRKEFEKFCGMWSKAEATEFNKAVKHLEKVDREDWR